MSKGDESEEDFKQDRDSTFFMDNIYWGERKFDYRNLVKNFSTLSSFYLTLILGSFSIHSRDLLFYCN